MEKMLTKMFGREKIMVLYFGAKYLLNAKYRKSFNQVKKRFLEIDDIKTKYLYKCLSEFFFNDDEYLDSDIGKKDMEDHIANRLYSFRHRTIPWINSLMLLEGSKVLEIGCGTGCTTLALAEQGCELTSIDVNDMHIVVARKRCELYNLAASISVMNATEISKINEKFDLIVFSASLEHMTYDERIISIKLAWDMLKKNGFLAVIDTPNRLYYFDEHSSFLHFYHWLPDQIAMQYSKFSPREACKNSSFDEMKFIRFGRGASFHEFEIALDTRSSEFEIYSMQSFEKTFVSKFLLKKYKYNRFLRKLGPPKISDSFYYDSLDIAIKKP